MNDTEPSARQALNDEAALWHARLESGTADRQAFESWRNTDPAHAAAFARIAATAVALDDIRGVDLSDDPELALTRPLRRRALLQWAACGVIGVAGIGYGLATSSRASASTSVGGRKTLTLPDGTRLDLNTDTQVAWKFDDKVRRIWLERGEVAISVKTDPRPCQLNALGSIVTLADSDVVARLRSKALDLTVLKGVCTVAAQGGERAKAAPVKVMAGEGALTVAAETRVRPVDADDIQFATGWRNDELVFTGQTLGIVVEEYNRYLTDKIVIVDPELAGIRLGGRFNVHDPKNFLEALSSSFGIHVTRSASGAVMLSK